MDDLLSQFKVMAIAAHCLHSGEKVEKTAFDDIQECTFGFCRTLYRLYGEAVQESGPQTAAPAPVASGCIRCEELRRAIATLVAFIPQESAYCYCTLFPGPHSHGLIDPINARANAKL